MTTVLSGYILFSIYVSLEDIQNPLLTRPAYFNSFPTIGSINIWLEKLSVIDILEDNSIIYTYLPDNTHAYKLPPKHKGDQPPITPNIAYRIIKELTE